MLPTTATRLATMPVDLPVSDEFFSVQLRESTQTSDSFMPNAVVSLAAPGDVQMSLTHARASIAMSLIQQCPQSDDRVRTMLGGTSRSSS